MAWFILPEDVLEGSIGIKYYPDKYWGVGIPAYFCGLVLLVQVIYQGLNLITAKPPTSFCTVEDQFTRRLPVDSKDWPGIEEVSDIPINVVCDILYSHKLDNNYFKPHYC